MRPCCVYPRSAGSQADGPMAVISISNCQCFCSSSLLTYCSCPANMHPQSPLCTPLRPFEYRTDVPQQALALVCRALSQPKNRPVWAFGPAFLGFLFHGVNPCIFDSLWDYSMCAVPAWHLPCALSLQVFIRKLKLHSLHFFAAVHASVLRLCAGS